MSTVRCATKPSKFKNLTLNKEYEATEENDRYLLTNDAGVSSRYAKKYFTDIPVVRSIIGHTGVHCNYDHDEIIEIDIVIGDGEIERTIDLSFYQADNSCGIKEVQGISELKSEIRDIYSRINHNIFVGSLTDLFAEVFGSLLDEMRANMGACVMITDAKREEDTEMDIWLTDQADAHWSGMNDNSSHMINVWIFGK